MKTKHILLAAAALTLLTACEKVSPIGVLVSGTAVEDRVKMSNLYYAKYLNDDDQIGVAEDEYTFLVGSDSHITTDIGRLSEMFDIGLRDGDMFFVHLGDIADTKAEYYINLDSCVRQGRQKYIDKYFIENEDGTYTLKDNPDSEPIKPEDLVFPFFPVVGNHDITHNGWALWSNIFHSSFYEFDIAVLVNGTIESDHFIFLDTASGTLGQTQVDLINQGALNGDNFYRHTFVFGHTNIFRPSQMEFASTFAREETFFLLNQFKKWNASIVFCGHVHKWDERVFDGVTYLTLDSMSEANSPNPGDYLVRVHVKKDGTLTWEKVRMNYTAKK